MQCLQPAAAAREGSRREDGLQENYRALALVLTAASERQASGGLAGSSSAMPLAPSLELRLSWWDDGMYSGAQSSGRHILFGIRDREEEEKHIRVFVRRENWILPLHAGAPGTDMKRGSLCPLLKLKHYTLGTMSPCTLSSITYAMHALYAPYQALGSSYLVCVTTLMHVPCPVSHVTYSLDPAPCTMSHPVHDALCTTCHLLNPVSTVSHP